MSVTAKRRFHRERNVRLHSSGKWICTIGRTWSEKKQKLLDKDWYFTGSEGDALEKANAKARQWELLCGNWDKIERPLLELLHRPIPHEPRWPTGGKTPVVKLTTEELAQAAIDRREGKIEWAEMAAAMVEFTFSEVITEYQTDRRRDVNEGQAELSTLAKEISQMRCVAESLPSDIPAIQLRAEHFRTAKTKLLKKHKRRTVRNYLSAGAKLLRWLYGRYGGEETRIPAGIEDAIALRQSTNLDITVHGIEELKILMEKTAGTISQLDLMLALNCGMYQEDIGRLLQTELDLVEGSVFWDREKEPGNPFRIHHIFWPETLKLVKQFLNPGIDNEVFIDHRIREGKPSQINTRDLAFLDKHRPRYTIKPSGSAYDLVGRRWTALKTGAEFRNLRKSTSEILTSLAEKVTNPDDRSVLVDVLQQRFLGQKTPQLLRLYRTIGKGAYGQMNQYLALVGDHLRISGLFDSLPK